MGEIVKHEKPKYEKPEEVLELVRTDFMSMADKLNFQKEFNYAIQMITKSSYSLECFKKNPMSLKFAMLNLAGIGLSLNPATKFAYLVPRDGAIILDISYMGLLELAIRDGGILWGQANVFKEKDSFTLFGYDQPPKHDYDVFASDVDRGDLKGTYCVVKTQDGSYLTTTMSKDAVEKIMKRSASHIAYISKKANTTPWITDPEEMWKKTVIKRAYKTWPKGRTTFLARAIEVLNEHEGIDFDEEKKTRAIDENVNLLDTALTKQKEELEIEKVNLANEILERSAIICAKYSDQEKIKFSKDILGLVKGSKVQDKSMDQLKSIMSKINEIEKKKEPINADSSIINDYNNLTKGIKL